MAGVNSKTSLKSENLWNIILDSLMKAGPASQKPVVNTPGVPPNRFMAPTDMNAVLNAFSPQDLALHPDTTPPEGIPSTVAFNARNYDGVGVPDVILQAIGQSPGIKGKFHSMEDTAQDYPEELRPYAAQDIYEHEAGHDMDPRIDPSKAWSFPNHGYTTYSGLSGGQLQSEFPAMVAEGEFMNFLRKLVGR